MSKSKVPGPHQIIMGLWHDGVQGATLATNRGSRDMHDDWGGRPYEHGPTIDREFIAALEEPLGWLLHRSRRELCDLGVLRDAIYLCTVVESTGQKDSPGPGL